MTKILFETFNVPDNSMHSSEDRVRPDARFSFGVPREFNSSWANGWNFQCLFICGSATCRKLQACRSRLVRLTILSE